ncbi:hypothetical protein R1flu_025605 [Riccia fluitans]|uniref:Uncharacterized protein n=1 Tax=Riccia fluitans TaxID=41844 RepID=A0ABD1XY77_9MARC
MFSCSVEEEECDDDVDDDELSLLSDLTVTSLNAHTGFVVLFMLPRSVRSRSVPSCLFWFWKSFSSLASSGRLFSSRSLLWSIVPLGCSHPMVSLVDREYSNGCFSSEGGRAGLSSAAVTFDRCLLAERSKNTRVERRCSAMAARF